LPCRQTCKVKIINYIVLYIQDKVISMSLIPAGIYKIKMIDIIVEHLY